LCFPLLPFLLLLRCLILMISTTNNFIITFSTSICTLHNSIHSTQTPISKSRSQSFNMASTKKLTYSHIIIHFYISLELRTNTQDSIGHANRNQLKKNAHKQTYAWTPTNLHSTRSAESSQKKKKKKKKKTFNSCFNIS